MWEWFKNGKLPTISELKSNGYWNANVGHLVRMSFITQMNLVSELQKIKRENLIEKVYEACGNQLVRPAYDFAIEKINTIIDKNEDKILVLK